MSKARTKKDHSYLDIKVGLRLDHLPNKKHLSVLDCFHGTGTIWQMIQRLRPAVTFDILGIDKKTIAGQVYLRGDNMAFLRSLDLRRFDIIDLDAYGIPHDQLHHVFSSPHKAGTVVFVTCILMGPCSCPLKMLYSLGYTRKMFQKCTAVFKQNRWAQIKDYLAANGVKRIRYYLAEGRKYYIWFRL